MQRPTTSTRELVHLAWPMLVAQLAMMANAVIDTAMAGRLTVIDLAAVGIAASIMATVLMSLVSVLFALPPIIAHLYGANRQDEIGREIHQGVWISLALALVAILLLGNIAMATYLLIQLFRLPTNARIEELLLRRK